MSERSYLGATFRSHRDIGKIQCSSLNLKEALQADELRQNVIRHMMTNIDQIRENVNGEAINVDMPARINFSCLEERLIAMAEPASFVSELEISQTSAFIKRKIILVQGDRAIIYGQEFRNGESVVLKYSPCGENSGHYECLVKITGQVRLPLLSSIARRLPSFLQHLPLPSVVAKLNALKSWQQVHTKSSFLFPQPMQTGSSKKRQDGNRQYKRRLKEENV